MHDTPARINALRELLAKQNLDGFFVPRTDEHQGEYVAPSSERLAWLTGFTGSAGFAIVTPETVGLFVDGRYTLQAQVETDPSVVTVLPLAEITPKEWLKKVIKKSQRFGFDPWLQTEKEINTYRQILEDMGASLVSCDHNFIDLLWKDKPHAPHTAVVIHEIEYAGRSFTDKIKLLASQLKSQHVDAAVITLTDSVAWLLNIRANDIPRTPVALAFAILHSHGTVDLFLNPIQVDKTVQAYFGEHVTVFAKADFEKSLTQLGKKHTRVLVDGTAGIKIIDILSAAGAHIVRESDPCRLPKACKNSVEVQGMKACHIRDGAALVQFLAWLYRTAPHKAVSELDACAKLQGFREQQALFKDLSFDSISGAGAHGAIIHYRVSPETDAVINPAEIYLIDSGGQYLDGTTDVTRTVIIGKPTQEQRDRFTRVLQGHINLARCVFPKGTSGSQVDVIARYALWQAGLDYEHGTGHGVGSYLCVHEGPQRIAKGMESVALKPGMILSNEPGYYKKDAYGIRIESLVVVTEKSIPGAESTMLGFDTLTVAPICRDLIDVALLVPAERDWINAYHHWVRETLTPLVDAETATWLQEQTAAV